MFAFIKPLIYRHHSLEANQGDIIQKVKNKILQVKSRFLNDAYFIQLLSDDV